MEKKRINFEARVDLKTDEGLRRLKAWFLLFDGKNVEIDIREKGAPKRRTPEQNNALHLYFALLADELNISGLDMKKTLKDQIAIPWTAETVKEYLWRPIQIAVLKKESTTELDKIGEIDEVYDVLNRHLSERFGIHVEFPHLEEGEKDKKGRMK